MKHKTVLLCICGGIAAYKSAYVASGLKKLGFDVHVIMSENATNFVTPLTFESLTGNEVVTDTFARTATFEIEHIALAKRADLVLVAPATANMVAKLANGIADDMMSTTILACTCKKMVAPAMNTAMYENLITRDNLAKLRHYDFTIIDPAAGRLACGDTGIGKMPEPETLLAYVMQELAQTKDMVGLNVLVTAGPTREALDPVRYLTNHSTGKMGYALAENAVRRGANVTLITGSTSLKKPPFVEVIEVTSAHEMFEAVVANAPNQDIFLKAAAVADYCPSTVQSEKIKKTEGCATLTLHRTEDILQYLGEHHTKDQFLCGFSMETQNLIENAKAKLEKKHLDLIVANNLKVEGAGFGTDTNVVTIIAKDRVLELPQLPKSEVAKQILDEIMRCRCK